MKTKIWMLLLMAALVILPAAAGSVNAQKKPDASKQKKQSFELKATKVEAGRGTAADPNIKDSTTANTQDQQFDAPPEKGGSAKGRGGQGLCRVNFDNRTGWRIQLYVDGMFRGVMAPFGDSVAFTGAGPTTVYARAEFTDGSALYWGPKNYTCYAGQYINFRMDP